MYFSYFINVTFSAKGRMHEVELCWNLVCLISYEAFYLSFVKSFSLYYDDQLITVLIGDGQGVLG